VRGIENVNFGVKHGLKGRKFKVCGEGLRVRHDLEVLVDRVVPRR